MLVRAYDSGRRVLTLNDVTCLIWSMFSTTLASSSSSRMPSTVNKPKPNRNRKSTHLPHLTINPYHHLLRILITRRSSYI